MWSKSGRCVLLGFLSHMMTSHKETTLLAFLAVTVTQHHINTSHIQTLPYSALLSLTLMMLILIIRLFF